MSIHVLQVRGGKLYGLRAAGSGEFWRFYHQRCGRSTVGLEDQLAARIGRGCLALHGPRSEAALRNWRSSQRELTRVTAIQDQSQFIAGQVDNPRKRSRNDFQLAAGCQSVRIGEPVDLGQQFGRDVVAGRNRGQRFSRLDDVGWFELVGGGVDDRAGQLAQQRFDLLFSSRLRDGSS